MNILSLSGFGQQLTFLTILQDSIKETSGLIYLNQKLITLNDTGEPALYEIDSISGEVFRKVIISNATNYDWEDICYDSTYIYIGDFGNVGSRTDLKIYRLSISSYLTTLNDTVTVDTIQFSYSDQTDFTPAQFTTNYDAEALISYNDSLYIFTKNWGNYWQVTYTQYSKKTKVKTLKWPLSKSQKKVLKQVCQAWLRAESMQRVCSLAPHPYLGRVEHRRFLRS